VREVVVVVVVVVCRVRISHSRLRLHLVWLLLPGGQVWQQYHSRVYPHRKPRSDGYLRVLVVAAVAVGVGVAS
jgi:hypothetical protein